MSSEVGPQHVIHQKTISVLAKALYDMKSSKSDGLDSLRELANLIRKHSTASSGFDGMHESSPGLIVPMEPGTYPFVLFLLGGPGSGKGTLSPQLEAKYGFTRLSVVDLLRAEVDMKTTIGMEAEDIMVSGGLISDTLAMKVIRSAIDKDRVPGKRFILYGYPRTVEQAVHFENNICPVSLVVWLTCDESVLVERLTDRSKADRGESLIARARQLSVSLSKIRDHYASTGKCHMVDTGKNTEAKVMEEVIQLLADCGISA